MQDMNSNNILHKMILQIYFHPELEDKVMHNLFLFLDLLKPDQTKTLLKAENKYGLRPLEFACQHGVCCFVTALMEVPGVYKYKQETKGILTYTYYDVTDYEGNHVGHRRHLSPLLLLAYIDRDALGRKANEILRKTDYMKKWREAKFSSGIPLLLLLFLLRLFYLGVYFAYEMDSSVYNYQENSTDFCIAEFSIRLSPSVRLGLAIYLLVHSCISVLIDIAEIAINFSKRKWPLYHTVRSKKHVMVHVAIYRSCNLIFALFMIIYVTVSTLNGRSPEDILFFSIARMICPVLSVWNFLFFIQLLPSIGHFVISIQEVLKDMFHFCLVYFLLFMPFTHTFKTFVNNNTKVGCMEEFTTLFRAAYSLFSVMLNMLSFKEFEVRNVEVLFLSHIVFTFLVSIMMINFFIALLSDTVSRVNSHRETAILRQRIAVCFVLEERLGGILRRVFPNMHQLEMIDDRVVLVQTRYNFEIKKPDSSSDTKADGNS